PVEQDNIEMPRAMSSHLPSAADLMTLGAQRIAQMLHGQAVEIDALKRQLEWFKRQVFGRKSERFAPEPDAQQMHLGQVLGDDLAVPPEQAAGAAAQVPAHRRRKPRSDFADDIRAAPFFDESKVP